jgi:hypothetical protein|tara:strand:- start:70 stop:573 length:504 start_codon:yes stop_codon:yes gene_type:complete
MASTVSSSTMIIEVKEKITLNGNKYDNIVEKRINGISQIDKRIVTIPANQDSTIATFKTAVGGTNQDGAVDLQDVKYIRLTNLDDTNSVSVAIQIDTTEDDTANSTAEMSFIFDLDAGMSWIFGEPHDSVFAKDDDATYVTTKHDIESIMVDSGSNAVDVEFLIAST